MTNVTDEQIEREQAQLDMLGRALKEFEVARFLVDLDGGKSVSVALKRIEEEEARRIAEAVHKPLNPTLVDALKNTRAARGRENIVLGQNKTRVTMNGKADAPAKRFNTVSNSADKEFNRLTREDTIDNHRSVGHELEWHKSITDRDATANHVQVIKRAVKKSQATVELCRKEHGKINSVAESIIRKKINENLTPAQRSIMTRPSAAEGNSVTPSKRSVKDMLPPYWRNSDEEHSLPVGRDISTRASMPNEFKPKITPTVDKSFGAVAARTKAAATISRPVASKDVGKGNDDQGIQDYNRPSAKATTTQTPDYDYPGKSNHPNQEKRWDVDLKTPKPPKQGFDPVNGAI